MNKMSITRQPETLANVLQAHNLLLNPTVRIANIEVVASKLQKLLSHGKNEVHFICGKLSLMVV